MTQRYESAEQFQDLFTELLARLERGGGLDTRGMVVQFRVTEPEVDMWVDGRHRPVTLSFGPQGGKATLTIDVTADALHEVLLGTLPLGKALSGGRLRVKGSKLRAMRLQGVFHAFQAEYPGLAAERLGDAGT